MISCMPFQMGGFCSGLAGLARQFRLAPGCAPRVSLCSFDTSVAGIAATRALSGGGEQVDSVRDDAVGLQVDEPLGGRFVVDGVAQASKACLFGLRNGRRVPK